MVTKQVTHLSACLLAVVLCISLSGCGNAPVNTAATATVSTMVTTITTTQ